MRDALLDDEQRAACCPRLRPGRRARRRRRLAVSAASFEEAIAWVVRIMDAAAELDHHPDIDIRWRTLRLVLYTDSGGITPPRRRATARIDEIVGG